jgi:DNA-binding NtrC family response regulator
LVADEAERVPPGDPELLAEPDERRRIELALERCDGNQSQAAKLLGISRRTLVTRLGEYGFPRPRKKSTEEP